MSDNNNNNYQDVCVICHRTEEQAGPMVHMPGNLCVCKDCMQKAFDQMSQMGFPVDPASMGFPGNPMGFAPNNNSFNQNNNGSVSNNDATASENKGTAEKPEEINSSNEGAVEVVNPDGTPAEEKKNPAGSDNNIGNANQNDQESANQNGSTQGNPNQGNSQGTPLGNIFSGMDGFPNISMINLNDILGGGFPGMGGGNNRVKKRRKLGQPAENAEAQQQGEDAYPILDIHNIPAPHKIKEQLDQYVIGQEQAKKYMSVAVYNHYKRIASEQQNEIKLGTVEDLDGVDIEKSNLMIIGPTGSGKTYMVRTLARLLDVPLAITDATSLTEAGYIGDDIESVVSKLLAAADNDVDRAEQGIIFIDEIDKLAKKKNANSRDVSGESVQQGMLKLLEGSEIEVPVGASSKNAMVPMATINTKNILFIVGGAFPGLEDIIKERLNQTSLMGFTSDLKDKYDTDVDILKKVRPEDLRKFGMIPEFLGRLPIITAFESLNEDMLVRILKEPKNAIIKQYEKLLSLDEVKLTFDEEALHAIAKKAAEEDLGARALRAIIEEFMMDIMYEIPKDPEIGEVAITADYINHKGGPRVTMRAVERIAEKHDEAETEKDSDAE